MLRLYVKIFCHPRFFEIAKSMQKSVQLDHLEQAFAARFPIVAGEDVRADFNQAGKHVEDRNRSP